MRPKLYRKIVVVGKINPGDISAKDMGDRWLSAITCHGKYQTSTQWVVTLGQYQRPLISTAPLSLTGHLSYEPSQGYCMNLLHCHNEILLAGGSQGRDLFSQFWRLKVQYPDAKTGVSEDLYPWSVCKLPFCIFAPRGDLSSVLLCLSLTSPVD